MRTCCALPPTLRSTTLWIVLAGVARAHDPGLSSVEATLHADRLHVRLTVAAVDVGLLLVREGEADERTRFQGLRGPLAVVARAGFEVRFGAEPVQPRDLQVELDREVERVHVELDFPRPPADTLRLRSTLFTSLPRGHRQYLTLRDARGELLAEELLDARHEEVRVTLARTSLASGAPGPSERLAVPGNEHLLLTLVLVIALRRSRRRAASDVLRGVGTLRATRRRATR